MPEKMGLHYESHYDDRGTEQFNLYRGVNLVGIIFDEDEVRRIVAMDIVETIKTIQKRATILPVN